MDPIVVQAPQRLYCGNKNPVPPGYAGYDTRYSCLRKGVGIGLYKIRRDAQAGGNGGMAPPPRVMVQQRLFPVKTWWSQVPWWGWAILLGLVILVILVILLFLLK